MPDDNLRDQVAKAVCSIAIGSERVETVMEIIQEHTAAQVERAEAAEAAIGRAMQTHRQHSQSGISAWCICIACDMARALAYDDAELLDQAHQQRHQGATP